MVIYKQGVCCGCQSVVPIVQSSLPREEEHQHGWDDELIGMHYGDSIDYICIDHDFYGEHCEGSGQIPQCVVKPK